MKVYLDCSPLTNPHLSGIGVYNRNLFLEMHKLAGQQIDPVLKLNRYSKKHFVEEHLRHSVHLLPPFILNKKIIYHGTDHKLNVHSRGPRIVTIHDMQPFVDQWLDPEFARKRRDVLTKTFKSSPDKIIAVSHFTKNEIIKYFPSMESRIEVVYHGADLEKKVLPVETNNLEKKIAGKPFLLFIGNIEERKNLINQLKAFALLKRENSELLFVMAGKAGFNYQSVEDFLSGFEFKNDVLLTGYLNETEKDFALKETSCLMFATWYEGFGIPVIEALAAGAPVLISRAGALQEIAGTYCESADPSSPEEMALKIKKIMNENSVSKIASMSEWKKNWSWEKTASETLKIYSQFA